MGQDGQAGVGVSSEGIWDRLEDLVREQAQVFVQRILEEEATEFLGRRKSERRIEVDGVAGYRNGSSRFRWLYTVWRLMPKRSAIRLFATPSRGI